MTTKKDKRTKLYPHLMVQRRKALIHRGNMHHIAPHLLELAVRVRDGGVAVFVRGDFEPLVWV